MKWQVRLRSGAVERFESERGALAYIYDTLGRGVKVGGYLDNGKPGGICIAAVRFNGVQVAELVKDERAKV